jgi:hypothetical protein
MAVTAAIGENPQLCSAIADRSRASFGQQRSPFEGHGAISGGGQDTGDFPATPGDLPIFCGRPLRLVFARCRAAPSRPRGTSTGAQGDRAEPNGCYWLRAVFSSLPSGGSCHPAPPSCGFFRNRIPCSPEGRARSPRLESLACDQALPPIARPSSGWSLVGIAAQGASHGPCAACFSVQQARAPCPMRRSTIGRCRVSAARFPRNAAAARPSPRRCRS